MITIKNPNIVHNLTSAQAKKLGIDLNSLKGDLETIGTWGAPKSFVALCISSKFKRFPVERTETTFYGQRKMSNFNQKGGYELDGWVSVGGKKVSCFTSSLSISIDNGESLEIAVIFARIK